MLQIIAVGREIFCYIQGMQKLFLLFFAFTLISFPLYAEVFPEDEQKAYLDTCTGGKTTAQVKFYCNCTLKEVQKRMTLEAYKALNKLPGNEAINDPKFNASISTCSRLFR